MRGLPVHLSPVSIIKTIPTRQIKTSNIGKKKGLKLIRLPFKWERLQLDLKGPLNQHDLNKMKELVRAAEKRDMVVILDLHNYCRRFMNNEHTLIGNNELTIEDLASFWQAIAKEFSTFKKHIWLRANERAT